MPEAGDGTVVEAGVFDARKLAVIVNCLVIFLGLISAPRGV
jgi:hypothetical protein